MKTLIMRNSVIEELAQCMKFMNRRTRPCSGRAKGACRCMVDVMGILQALLT
jgi:hypothetical protein